MHMKIQPPHLPGRPGQHLQQLIVHIVIVDGERLQPDERPEQGPRYGGGGLYGVGAGHLLHAGQVEGADGGGVERGQQGEEVGGVVEEFFDAAKGEVLQRMGAADDAGQEVDVPEVEFRILTLYSIIIIKL